MGFDLRRRELLLVEDQPILRSMIASVLRSTGFSVTTAAGVSEAVTLIRANHFDLLISDLNLDSVHDGFDVIAEMQRTQPQAITCILTATPNAKSLLWAMRHNVDGYYEKSSDIFSMAQELMEYVSLRRSLELAAA